MAVSSMCSSAGRVIGPPVFGTLYAVNIHFPYRLSAVLAAVAGGVYVLVGALSAPKPEVVRPAEPLAAKDAARQRSFSRDDEKKAIAELQELLARTLKQRGYDLGSPGVVELIKHLLLDALPEKVEGKTDEQLLAEEVELMHQHFDRIGREHDGGHGHQG